MELYRCDSCGHEDERDGFVPADKLSERLAPGGTYTDAECPLENCGALAFPTA